MLKLNIDGSYSESTGAAGAGMILRDEHGRIVFSSCRFLNRCGSALEAELSACMEGMSLALEWSQQDVLVETDFMEVAKMINNPSRDSSQLGHLVEHVKHLMNQGRRFVVNKISREMNQASDLLARFGRLEE